MRRIFLFSLFPAAAFLAFAQPLSATGTAHAGGHPLTAAQASRIARLVARHERINLSDTHIEFNSMDLGADFVPGFSSFIVIRESTTPGPDETLRRYAVSRRTGDVWEMNLCTHYAFPELERMQVALAGRPGNEAAEIAEQGRQLGCSEPKGTPRS